MAAVQQIPGDSHQCNLVVDSGIPKEVSTKYKNDQEVKEVKDNLSSFDFYLCIVDLINSGLRPSKIAVKLGISKQRLQYYLTHLKQWGVIRKVGYGTWESLKPLDQTKKEVKVISYVGTKQVKERSKIYNSNHVRAHAVTTRFQVPRDTRNWSNRGREQFLTAHHIPFVRLGIRGGGQRIIVKGRKVWLLNKSLIVYDTGSFFAPDALAAKSTAIATHISIVKHVERLLYCSFLIGDDYKFKVSRQHYSLIHNTLAKQYNDAGEKLEVRNGRGLWFLVDDSFNLDEAETVHPSSAMTDNQKIQAHFNDVKDLPPHALKKLVEAYDKHHP